MTLGRLWSPLFFLLLLLASLTSTISMAEIAIAYFSEERKMSRSSATALTIGICGVLGTLCALSFGPLGEFTICGMTIFNLFDFVSSTVLLPLGGIFISLYVGFVLKRSAVDAQLQRVPAAVVGAVLFCLRFVAPICITLIFLSGLGLF